jgi:hypothetical protein
MNKRESNKNESRLILTLLALVGTGLVLVAFFSSGSNTSWSGFLRCLSLSLLSAAAAFVAGSLLGFIFGIPRPQFESEKPDEASSTASGETGKGLLPNTNLVQISDWLTKMLVGVGLVELSQIRDHFVAITQSLGAGLGTAGVVPFVAALLIFFSVLGFLTGYLTTRLVLTPVMASADRAALLAAVARVDEKLATVEKTSRSAQEASTETAMFTSLYSPPPAGFETVLQAGTQYLHRFGEPQSGRFFLYLACAWGQKASWLQEQKRPDSEVNNAKAKALDYIKIALDRDPSQKTLVRELSDPEAYGGSPEDNDFVILRDHDDFLALVAQ